MADTTLFLEYVNLLIPLKVEYAKWDKAGNTPERERVGEIIKLERFKMLMNGVDHYEVEREVFRQMYGKEPTPEWTTAFAPYFEETYLMKKVLDLKEYARLADTDAQRNWALAQADAIRIRVRHLVTDDRDLLRFEYRVNEVYFGREMTPEEKKIANAAYNRAIAAYKEMAPEEREKKFKVTLPEHEQRRPDRRIMEYKNHYSETYSGADMVVFMAFPGYKPIEVGVLSTVSHTVYREKKQVRTLGRISAMGITKGPRTISGRLIFTVIREDFIEMLRKEIPYLRNITQLLMDELPPFDLFVSFGNEYGAAAGLVIQGITTVDEQKTMSIEDLFTEHVFTYLARGLEPMRDMNATRLKDVYDPLTWFTSSFRQIGSEALANFRPKALQLYQDVSLVPVADPFYGNVAGWDSKLYQFDGIASASIANGSGGSGGSSGGSSGGGGSGGEISDPNTAYSGNLYIHVLTDATKSSGINGASVTVADKKTRTTQASGAVSFDIDKSTKKIKIEVKKSGYKSHSKTHDLKAQNGGSRFETVTIRLTPEQEGAQPELCKNNPAIAQKVGMTKAGGVWYEKGATDHVVTLRDMADHTPQPAAYIMNACGDKLSGYPCYTQFRITNFSSVKDNNTWKDTLDFIATPKVNTAVGYLMEGKNWSKGRPNGSRIVKTNSNGAYICPEFNYRLFPDKSRLEIRIMPWKTREDSDMSDPKLWVTFYFELGSNNGSPPKNIPNPGGSGSVI